MYVDIVISNVFNLNKHFFFFSFRGVASPWGIEGPIAILRPSGLLYFHAEFASFQVNDFFPFSIVSVMNFSIKG